MQQWREKKVVVACHEGNHDAAVSAEEALEFQRRVYSAETTTEYEDPADRLCAAFGFRETTAFGGLIVELAQVIQPLGTAKGAAQSYLRCGCSRIVSFFPSGSICANALI